jgi:hypothetical protein
MRRPCWRCWPGWLTRGAAGGVRHKLAVILGLAVCAVLAGARSFTAIAEWAADAETLARLGVAGVVPSESTFRRTLPRLDAGAVDDLAGACAARRTQPGPGGRRVIAVDGKTLRGSGHGSQDGRHLLAAFDHACGAVLGQVEVDAKTNEIPMVSTLLDRRDVAGTVSTADALHARREHATHLARRSAHYLLPDYGSTEVTDNEFFLDNGDSYELGQSRGNNVYVMTSNCESDGTVLSSPGFLTGGSAGNLSLTWEAGSPSATTDSPSGSGRGPAAGELECSRPPARPLSPGEHRPQPHGRCDIERAVARTLPHRAPSAARLHTPNRCGCDWWGVREDPARRARAVA